MLHPVCPFAVTPARCRDVQADLIVVIPQEAAGTVHQMHDGSLQTRVPDACDEGGAVRRTAIESSLDAMDAGGCGKQV